MKLNTASQFSRLIQWLLLASWAWAPAAGAISIDIGNGTAPPGGTAQIAVTLRTTGAEVVGTQNSIAFAPPLRIAALPNGAPDCAVSPDIQKEATSFSFSPPGCVGLGCTSTRAFVLAFDNRSPIPDGSVLYTCRVTVDPSAAAGDYPLLNSRLGASDASGHLLPASGRDGEVEVFLDDASVAIEVGDVRAVSGQQAIVTVRLRALSAGAPEVAGTQNEIFFDPTTPIAATGDGEPDCSVNPDLHKEGTSFLFLPPECTIGVDCAAVRALVLAFDNTTPIADGAVLYRCGVKVATDATVGTYPLTNDNAVASDPSGDPVAARARSGQVEVICAGDCDHNGQVAIFELVRGVNILLGNDALSVCQTFDSDDNGDVHVNEVVQAVSSALRGCRLPESPSATPTATLTATPNPTQTVMPTSTSTATITQTVMPTSTSTATITQTVMPTSTSTATIMQTVMPTSGTRTLHVGSAVGAPGETVTVDIGVSGGDGMTTVQVGLAFDPALLATSSEQPCTIDPRLLGQGSFEVEFRQLGASRVQVGIIDKAPPIESFSAGRVMSCQFTIQPMARPGVAVLKPILDRTEIADAGANPYRVEQTEGAVEISPPLPPTETPSMSPHATPTPTQSRPAFIAIGSVLARPGSEVGVPVTLDPGAQITFYARNDIVTETLSAVLFKRLPNGQPDCTLNPDIAANTAISRVCLDIAPSGGCRKTRVIVFRQNAPLPGGLLYTCIAVVDPSAALGTYPLDTVAVEVRDIANQPVPSDDADGSIEVVSEVPP